MSKQAQKIAEMVDMLPEDDRTLAYEIIKKMILAWDPDYTKLTPKEAEELKEAENSGYTNEKDIDWDNLEKYL
jgi:hypothetical protein